MSPVLGIIASSTQQGRAGGPVGVYDSLATVIVPSGGLSTLTFAGIPTGYRDLQLRMMARTDRPTDPRDYIRVRFNADSGSNYTLHEMLGNGSAATGSYDVGANGINLGLAGSAANAANVYGVNIMDILDYSIVTKNKSARITSGVDNADTTGSIRYESGVWQNTSAITSITILPGIGSNFIQYSSFALYGVK